MSEKNTQLTNASGYDVSRIRFSKPILGSIPDSKPAISFQRINISTQNEDNTVGDLVLPVGPNFSFGVSENVSMDSGKVNGWVLPICLYNKDGATEAEKQWVITFNNIVEHCKKHILDNKEEIGKYDLELSDLKKLNPLYYRRDKNNKGKIIEDSVTLYAKLIHSKKADKITSMFSDFDGNPVNPMDLIGKYCTVHAAIKIESIFIGNKISLQVKLYECEVKLLQTGMQRLLSKGNTNVSSSVSRTVVQKAKVTDDMDMDDDAGSIPDEDVIVDTTTPSKTSDDAEIDVDDEVTKPVLQTTAPKKIVKRVVKKA
jgi:hypothetical protein